ncbi:helix-turn-helix domain-containing protein [Paenibacillus lentus]|uniref:helix-turn-helix domain-containing protein n=1 Tax=Paenibacillus lentus TaxID=1338368 RepID=UPI003667FE02
MSILRRLVGENIRRVRKEQGLTQEELAEKAELQYQYIGGVERGTRNISLDSLEKIINALNITYSELFKVGDHQIVSNEETNKEYILFLHNQLLMKRTLDDIKAIHRITEEILRSFR